MSFKFRQTFLTARASSASPYMRRNFSIIRDESIIYIHERKLARNFQIFSNRLWRDRLKDYHTAVTQLFSFGEGETCVFFLLIYKWKRKKISIFDLPRWTAFLSLIYIHLYSTVERGRESCITLPARVFFPSAPSTPSHITYSLRSPCGHVFVFSPLLFIT